jgi:hypothetical protein
MILEINQVLVWCPTLCPHGHQQSIYIYHYQQEQTTQGFHMHTSAMYLILRNCHCQLPVYLSLL